ncbi:MAG: hypothetical protein KAI47_16860, partial [Deltaproteobacteria bacterium]|nr:hypothetical protein [Deltaproteobacteria bacterium]
MRVKFSLEVTVRVDGEAMMSHQLMNRPLTVGHAKGSTLLLDTPIETLTLLPLLPGGFGLHLAPGLRGKVRVGSRTLEIQDGLIRDPRPEPLCFRDGDRGVLFLDEHVELRFTVRQQRRAFVAPWVPRDRQLLFSLGGSAIALLGLALAIVSTPPPPAQHHRTAVPLLKARPAIITRTFLKPRAPHPRKSPPRAGHGPGALASRRAVSKSHGQSRRLRQAHRHEATRSAHRTAQVVDRLLARLGSAPTLNIAPSPSKGPSSHPRSLRARQAHAHDALSALDRILPTATAMAQQTSLGIRHRLRLKPRRPHSHLTPAPPPN